MSERARTSIQPVTLAPPPPNSKTIVGCVLTHDEESNIGEVIASLKKVTNRILVVDSNSTDGTIEVAEGAGAEVLQRAFDSFSKQRNWALDEIGRKHGVVWVLALDADERLSPGLASEIKRRWAEESDIDIYLIRRQLVFAGRTLRFGGFSKTRLPRLFRLDAGRYEDREVNEHFVPGKRARMASLGEPLVHLDVSSWEHYIAKHNRYSTLEALARLRRKQSGERFGWTTFFRSALDARRRPHLRRRWMREQLLDRVPGKAFLRFVHIYLLLGGFLDGSAGFKAALFQAWQEMTTDLKYREMIRKADG